MIFQLPNTSDHELSAFFHVVLGAPPTVPVEKLLAKNCVLNGKGKNVKIELEGSLDLHPIPKFASLHSKTNEFRSITEEKEIQKDVFQPSNLDSESKSTEKLEVEVKSENSSKKNELEKVEDSNRKSASGNKKRKTKAKQAKPKSSSNSNSQDFVSSLQAVALKEGLKIVGTIIDVAFMDNDVRILVNFDVYFPIRFWSHGCFWKQAPLSAFTLSHFRSDWESRKQAFQRMEEKAKQSTVHYFRNGFPGWASSSPECNVVGCKIHPVLTEKEKKDRFDLPSLFRTLHPTTDQSQVVRTEIHPAFKGKSDSIGIWSLNETLLSLVFMRLSPRSLRTLCCVCKNLNEVIRRIIPWLKVNLYPHQERAVNWMLDREAKPKPVVHPCQTSMTTANGFPYLINRLTGDLHFIGAKTNNGLADKQDTSDSVPDFRGGFLCDDPGSGKTFTAISLILREQGKIAEPPSHASTVSTFYHPDFPAVKGAYYETHDKLNETLASLKESSNVIGKCFKVGDGVDGMQTLLEGIELLNQNEGLIGVSCSPPLSSKRKSVSSKESPSPKHSPVSVLNSSVVSSLKPPTCSKSIRNLGSIALSESIVKSSPSKTASKRGETPSEKEEMNLKVNPSITKSFPSFQSLTHSSSSKPKTLLADSNLNSIVPPMASKNENIHRFSKTVTVNNTFSNIQPSPCPEFDTRKLPHSFSSDTSLFNSRKKKGDPTFESEDFSPLHRSEGSSLRPFATARMNFNELKRSRKSTPIKRCFLTFSDDDIFYAHNRVIYQELYTHELRVKALRNRWESNLIFESLPRDVNNLFLKRSVKKVKSFLFKDTNHFQNNHNVLTLPSSNIGSKHPLNNVEQNMSMNIPSQTDRYTKRRRVSYFPNSSSSPNSSKLSKNSFFFPSLGNKKRSWIPVEPRLSCFKNDVSNEYSSIDFPLKRNSNHFPKPILKLPKISQSNDQKRVQFASEDKIIFKDKIQKVNSVNESILRKSFKPSSNLPFLQSEEVILKDEIQKVKSFNESTLGKSFKPSSNLSFLQPNSADGTLHPPPFTAKSKPLSPSFTNSSDASLSFSKKPQAISMNKPNNATTESKSSFSRNKRNSSPKDSKKVNVFSASCLGPTLEKRGEEEGDMEEDEILPRMHRRERSIGGTGGIGKQDKTSAIEVKEKEKVGVEEKREGAEEEVGVEEEYYYTPHASWLECCKCKKWRRVSEDMIETFEKIKWYCIYNLDEHHNRCSHPEERNEEDIYIQKLLGFFFKNEQVIDHLPENVFFFKEILMAHKNALIKNHDVIKAIQYLSQLNAEQSIQLTSAKGLTMPPSFKNTSCFSPLFLSFGLLKNLNAKHNKQGHDTWHYPPNLHPDLAFDFIALQKALLSSLQSPQFEFPNRTFLSRATLVIVPAHRVAHWLGQINTHLKLNSLRVHVIEEPEHLSLPVYRLANDYDVVITTFNRLSAEWTKSKGSSSPLMKIHWFRVILDEGHTLGSSLNLIKLEMAVALKTSRRWLLTGTPTPNTPSSQVSHLQPLLRFLHESVFGDQRRLFENAIQKPFEAYEEEGFVRLHALLQRCMITSSKSMINSIPRTRTRSS